MRRLRGDEAAAWVRAAASAGGGARRAVLFTAKATTTGLFKALSSRFRGQIEFGLVACGGGGAAPLRRRLGVGDRDDDLPALFVLWREDNDDRARAAFRKLLSDTPAAGGGGRDGGTEEALAARVPLGAKPTFMRLEFALKPFARAPPPTTTTASESSSHKKTDDKRSSRTSKHGKAKSGDQYEGHWSPDEL